jgi:peptide/nickel transport system substrate-binding protein
MKRLVLLLVACASLLVAGDIPNGRELRACLRSQPKTFDPALVADDASETIRYLTGGVLIRVNRITQALEPELAISWKLSGAGRAIHFRLREGVAFSDGAPFTAADVAFTFQKLMAPEIHSPTADSFRSAPGAVRTTVEGDHQIGLTFPAPIAGIERLFDQVAIVRAGSNAVLGPFQVAENKPGVYIRLARNPHYWKRDSQGSQLPYLDSIRLDIQQNRQLELLRLERHQLDLVSSLDPEQFQQLSSATSGWARDAGPALEPEVLWFNQAARAPVPEYRKAWFRSQNFRRAISEAIHRDDLCRLIFRGHAQPAAGPVSPANRFWFNSRLKPHPYDPRSAARRLAQDGFHKDGESLRDRDGRLVEFSLITNSGNRARERMAALIQSDLRAVGIRLNVVTLDFPSLIERLTRSFDYEACLLGMINTDLDPNSQMNVWLSSADQHQWNPNQKTPATPWEAEIDRLMRLQASTLETRKRKAYFDRVQEIAWEQEPFLYLLHKNTLVAVSPALRNVRPSVLRPELLWNVERLWLAQ